MAIALQSSETTPVTTPNFRKKHKKTIRQSVKHHIDKEGDDYEVMRRRYNLFNNPEFFINQLKEDGQLFPQIVCKMNKMILYKNRRITNYWNGMAKLKGNVFIPTEKMIEKNPSWLKTNQFTQEVWNEHFFGYSAVGMLFRNGNKFVNPNEYETTPTKHFVIDIDIDINLEGDIKRCEKITLRLYNTMKKYINPHISFSGGKGFHLEAWLQFPLLSKDVAIFRDLIIEESGVKELLTDKELRKLKSGRCIESFPKYKAGTGVKLPLCIHPKTGLFAGYIVIQNNQFIPLKKPYQYFIQIPLEDPTTLLQAVAQYKENRAQQRLKETLKKTKQANEKKAKEIKQTKGQIPQYERETLQIKEYGNIDLAIPRIQEHGLLISGPGNRHDTTLIYLRHLKQQENLTNEHILDILTEWSKDVLYKKCGNVITTCIDEHIEWLEQAVQYDIGKYNNNNAAYGYTLLKEEFMSFVPFCQSEKGMDLKKMKIAIGLYLYAKIKQQLQIALNEEKEYVSEKEDGFVMQVSIRYLNKILNMSGNTILLKIEELSNIQIVSKGFGGMKKEEKELWDSAMYFLNTSHLPTNKNDDSAGNTIAVQMRDLERPSLIQLLFAGFCDDNELVELFGKNSHHHRTIKKQQKTL